MKYKSLNSNTIIDRYPIPGIDNMLDRLGHAIIYSKTDLASGYHQVEMHLIITIRLHFKLDLAFLNMWSCY